MGIAKVAVVAGAAVLEGVAKQNSIKEKEQQRIAEVREAIQQEAARKPKTKQPITAIGQPAPKAA